MGSMPRFAAAIVVSLAPLLGACVTNAPPARWIEGGAALEIPNARWAVGDDVVIIRPDGVVQRNGDFELAIDRAGRVFDDSNEPLAVLEPDGRVLGPNDADLGRVGSVTASLPGWDVAWLMIGADGQVTHFSPEGERQSFGAWVGCAANARTALACSLVTHLLAIKYQGVPQRSSSFGIGVGVGVGVGVGPGAYGGAAIGAPLYGPAPLP